MEQYNYIAQLPNPVAVLNGPGHHIEVANSKMLELWGASSEEVLFQPLFNYFPEEHRAKLGAACQRVLEHGTEVVYDELTFRFARNGQQVTEIHKVVLAPLASSIGRVSGILVNSYNITSEAKDRNKLKDSEAFIRTALESSPDCVKVLDDAGRLNYMNHEGLCIMEIADFGMVQNRYWWELWPSESQELVKASVQQALDGVTTGFQAFCSTAEGTPKWWDVKVSPISTADGKVSQIISVSRDITAQKKAAEKLEENKEELRSTLENAAVGIAQVSLDGRWLSFNERLCTILGRSREELLGCTVQDITHPGDQHNDLALRQQLTDGTTGKYSIEKRYIRKDGATVWIKLAVSAVRYADNSLQHFIFVAEDISAQKKAEAELLNRNRHLDLLARTAQSLIVSNKEESELLQTIFDDVCQTLDLEMFYNFLAEPGACLLRLNTWGGLTADEARLFSTIQFGKYLCGRVAKSRKVLIAEDMATVAHDGGHKLRAAGVLAYAGFPLIAQNELIGTIAFTTRQRTHFQEGEIQLIQAICDQIAATIERSRLNRELQESEGRYRVLAEQQEFLVEQRTRELEQSNQELQRSNEDLQQFAHVASHDLKEPVRKVLTFHGRLIHEFAAILPEKANMYLSRMEVAARRSYSMIEGLLHYAKVDSATKVPEPVDLNEVLRHIETDLDVVVHQKDATLQYGRLPVIAGAPDLIYQLFYNLVVNALKFSIADVPPQIKIWAQEGDTAMRQGTDGLLQTDGVTIFVQDNGVGFDQEHAEKIFQTYARLHSKDKYEGSGLGLALCRKIVERHNGSIAARGIKGEGATFTITLPAIVLQAAARADIVFENDAKEQVTIAA